MDSHSDCTASLVHTEYGEVESSKIPNLPPVTVAQTPQLDENFEEWLEVQRELGHQARYYSLKQLREIARKGNQKLIRVDYMG